MSKKIKVYEIEPSENTSYDIELIEAGNSWEPALNAIERSLERQFLDAEEGDVSWDEIKVVVKCKYMTHDDFNETMKESEG